MQSLKKDIYIVLYKQPLGMPNAYDTKENALSYFNPEKQIMLKATFVLPAEYFEAESVEEVADTIEPTH